MKDRNIVLIGFMGSGKSSVSRQLGKLLKREVFSTDKIIEDREKRPISDIFTHSGEEYFRKCEHNVVKELATKSGVIIDCGGGIILDETNVQELKKNGVFFYLKATPEFLFEKVKNQKHRPLLQVEKPLEKIKQMLNDRSPLYEKAADYTIISTDRTIDKMAKEVMTIYERT